MDTNQPDQYNQQPAQNNDYDFIMSSQNSGNKSPLFAPENTKMRIMIFAGGIILLLILIMVFFSFLNSAGGKQRDNLLKVARTQQEITRVLGLGLNNITDSDLKNKATTLKAVVASSQQDILAALSARGKNASPKDLEKGANPQNDADLENALAQAKHDEVFNEILLSLINQYASELNTVFSEGNASEQELATDAYNQVDLIFNLSQVSDTDTNTNMQTSTQ